MSVRNPLFVTSSLNFIMTRRRLMFATGPGALALLSVPRVLGHDEDDDHDDDDSGRGRGRGRGRGGDDDVVIPSGTVPAGSFEIRIDDDDADGFQPGTVTIDAGDSVTWVNLDDDPHTATGAGFDTGIMQPGDLVTVAFDEPGSFPYSCQIHPIMTGQVNVRNADGQVPEARAATPESSPQASPAAGGDNEMQVTIVDLRFEPGEIWIPPGTTVTWTNEDPLPHTATADDGTFDSGTLNQVDTFSHTFETAGTFQYICAIHPSMRGTVIVEG